MRIRTNIVRRFAYNYQEAAMTKGMDLKRALEIERNFALTLTYAIWLNKQAKVAEKPKPVDPPKPKPRPMSKFELRPTVQMKNRQANPIRFRNTVKGSLTDEQQRIIGKYDKMNRTHRHSGKRAAMNEYRNS